MNWCKLNIALFTVVLLAGVNVNAEVTVVKQSLMEDEKLVTYTLTRGELENFTYAGRSVKNLYFLQLDRLVEIGLGYHVRQVLYLELFWNDPLIAPSPAPVLALAVSHHRSMAFVARSMVTGFGITAILLDPSTSRSRVPHCLKRIRGSTPISYGAFVGEQVFVAQQGHDQGLLGINAMHLYACGDLLIAVIASDFFDIRSKSNWLIEIDSGNVAKIVKGPALRAIDR